MKKEQPIIRIEDCTDLEGVLRYATKQAIVENIVELGCNCIGLRRIISDEIKEYCRKENINFEIIDRQKYKDLVKGCFKKDLCGLVSAVEIS